MLLYGGFVSDVISGGVVSSSSFPIQRGILQGCPASGSLWAILFDPIVRSLAAANPKPGGSLTAFADDLAAAFINVLLALRPLMDIFTALPRATGLNLHVPKIVVWNNGACSDFELSRRLHDRLGSVVLRVYRSAKQPWGARWSAGRHDVLGRVPRAVF